MRAMVFNGNSSQLHDRQVPDPQAGAGQLLIDVRACGVCRTDLHLIDRELPHPKQPVIPGHELVGTVAALGAGVDGADFMRIAAQIRLRIETTAYTLGEASRALDDLRSGKLTGAAVLSIG